MPNQYNESDFDPAIFAGLPFTLPTETPEKAGQSANWLAKLDEVDPYVAGINEVWELAKTAPSLSAGHCLAGLARCRQEGGQPLGHLPVDPAATAFLEHIEGMNFALFTPAELEALAEKCPASLPDIVFILNRLIAFKFECQMAALEVENKLQEVVFNEWQGETENSYFAFLWSLVLSAPWNQQAAQTLRMYLSQAPLYAVGMTIQKVLDSTSPTPKQPAAPQRGGMSI